MWGRSPRRGAVEDGGRSGDAKVEPGAVAVGPSGIVGVEIAGYVEVGTIGARINVSDGGRGGVGGVKVSVHSELVKVGPHDAAWRQKM
jgi:hypothetical protein